MHSPNCLRALSLIAAIVFGAASLAADVVETKGGARITGKVTSIAGGAVVVETDYAGTISIKQSEVVSIKTDAPVAIRLVSGTRIDGTVSGSEGRIQIANVDGTLNTTIAKVAASWTAGGKDPQVAALEKHWAYEASADITGRSGNKSQLGTAAAFRATLAGPDDTLAFYTAYNRQVTDGEKSSDQFKGGVDYSRSFSGSNSWYVRDEGGFDRIKDVTFYNVAAAGFGYDVIKKPAQLLTLRAGLSFRNENYGNPLTEDVNAAGLDLGLSHSLTMSHASLVNRLSLTPAFSDFGNFRLTHESFLELPLANPSWKLRFGLTNDYNSQPGAGVKKLDTGYFTRLVLRWK